MKILKTLVALSFTLNASAQLNVKTIGFNNIQITSRFSHSVALKFNNDLAGIIPPFGTRTMEFNLSNWNVRNTNVNIFYNEDCRAEDEITAYQTEKEIKTGALDFKKRMIIVKLLLEKQCSWIYIIEGIKFLGIPTPYTDKFNEFGIMLISRRGASDLTCSELSLIADEALELTVQYFYSVAEETRNRLIENATTRLNSFRPETYELTKFLRPQWSSSLDLSISHPRLLVNKFRNEEYAKGELSNFKLKDDPAYGISFILKSKSYKTNKRKRTLTKNFIKLEYTSTPTIYHPKADTIFTPGTGYKWSFYNIGLGWQIYSPRFETFSFIVEGGAISNSCRQVFYNDGKEIKRINTVSNFKGTTAYVLLGAQLALSKRFEAFLHWRTPLFVKQRNDLPSFVLVTYGLRYTLRNGYSYQY